MKRSSRSALPEAAPDTPVGQRVPVENAPGLGRKTDRKRGRIVVGTILFVVFVCIALLVTNAWLVVRARAAEVAQIARANTNLARAVSQQIESILVLAEHIISGLVFELEREDITADRLQRLQPVLVNHVAGIRAVKALFIYDEQGRSLVHSEPTADVARDDSHGAYFAYHRDNPSLRMLIGGPVVNRASGEWIIPLSRRINDPEGNFAGVVLVTLSVKNLLALLDRFEIGKRGAIALFRSDQMLVRRPFVDSDMGRLSTGTRLQQIFRASRSGTVEGQSNIDGVRRIISFEHLPEYPLFVTVAVAKDEALQEWQASSIYQTAWTILLCAIFGVSGRFLVRSMRRRLVAEQHLRSARDALTKANERLEHLAQEDGLTGLANRRNLDARLLHAHEQALQSQTPLAIVMVDVDAFKKYNDLYGHLEGDECLRRIAQALRSAACRADDLVARYGGEEMVLLLPTTDAEGALEVAQRARLAVLDLQIPHAASAIGTVSISLGVAAWVPEPGSMPAQLLRAADEALYLAKREGRNRVGLHDGRSPTIHSPSATR